MTTENFILEHGIVAICRRLYGDDLKRLADALNRGGVKMMEVTFDQASPSCVEDTSAAIGMLVSEFGNEMRIGAGTVLTEAQVEAAYNAGAQYIISPNVNEKVIRKTLEKGLISMPGAMTPTEILRADELGAQFVKLFPAGYLGFSYIKDILGPISQVRFIATGGVNEETLPRYYDMGFCGAGISGRLTDRKLIESGDFEEFTRRARIFCEITEQRRAAR